MSSYKYTDLIKLGTQYANRMNYLSNRIFGEVARTTNEKSMKVGNNLKSLYKYNYFNYAILSSRWFGCLQRSLYRNVIMLLIGILDM